MSTYPLPTLAGQVTPTGFSAPSYSDIYASEIATEQSIFGSDIVLDSFSQDGQRLVARCAAINDANNMAEAVYNSFFPGNAQGTGLAALVQINGLTKNVPTDSTAVLTLGGVVGTVSYGWKAIDTNNNIWDIPDGTEIGQSGTVQVTATCETAGAVTALAGAINRPYTIVDGWQTVTNAAAATAGLPVETDAALRRRQAASTALPAIGPLDSIMAAVAQSGGVGRYQGYENDTDATDANGIPAGQIAVVVEGGNATAIAQAIQTKKAPGIGTYGTTSVQMTDQKGVPITINFFELTDVAIYAAMTIQPLNGYVSTTGTAAVNALVDYLNGLGIGNEVYLNSCIAAAALFGVNDANGNPLSATFAITSLTIGLNAGALAAANISIAFNEAAQCASANVTLTVL